MAFLQLRQRLLAAVLAGVAAWAWAQGAPSAAQPAKPASAAAKPAAKAPVVAHPLWNELKPAQKTALEPLAAEWDKMDGLHKQKWLQIANRFSAMKPDEQQRTHDRMRDWVKMTPEQHRLVRENYTRAKKLDPNQKASKWEEYQQLPEEQKKKLAAQAASTKKQVANLPAPQPRKPAVAAQPAASASATQAPATGAPVTAPPAPAPAVQAPAAGAPAAGTPAPTPAPAPAPATPAVNGK